MATTMTERLVRAARLAEVQADGCKVVLSWLVRSSVAFTGHSTAMNARLEPRMNKPARTAVSAPDTL